jgi:acyl-CoA reductase-like NAD-dependent aldehyde dehydrogenase
MNVAMRGFFQNCGQNCVGLERLLVQAPLYERAVAEITRRVRGLRQGPPLDAEVDVGALTMPRAWVKMEALVADAVAHGARLLAGGQRNTVAGWPHGFYFAPTVLADVTPAMRIAQEEVFGPIVVIMRFSTDAEALSLVNACAYGLGASVFSTNADRAERLVRGIRSGAPAHAHTHPGRPSRTDAHGPVGDRHGDQACAT